VPSFLRRIVYLAGSYLQYTLKISDAITRKLAVDMLLYRKLNYCQESIMFATLNLSEFRILLLKSLEARNFH